MKNYSGKDFSRQIPFVIPLLALIFLKGDLLKAQDLYFEEIQIDTSTKADENSSGIPTNPFEIVGMKKKKFKSINHYLKV